MARNDLLKIKVVIEFTTIGFECVEPCEEWLEVKHKEDKTANGLFFGNDKETPPTFASHPL